MEQEEEEELVHNQYNNNNNNTFNESNSIFNSSIFSHGNGTNSLFNRSRGEVEALESLGDEKLLVTEWIR